MPDYVLTHHYIDNQNGETTRSFRGTFADYATARAAADAFLTDAQNASSAHLFKESLSEENFVAGAPGPGTVFERAQATVEITGNKRASISIPAPVAALFSGNALDPTATQWTDYVANLSSDWTISDGDNYSSTISGKRVYVNSGKTNLPR